MSNKQKELIIAFLGLGSNVSDRIANIKNALILLEKRGILIEKRSSFYKTEPVEFKDQPWFLNLVIKILTSMSPEELLENCQEVERTLGRYTKGDMKPRTIDIDILLYGNEVIEKEDLHIPHHRMHLRRFMLEPLHEIAPDLSHPGYNKTISQLLEELTDSSKVIKLAENCKGFK